MRVSRPWLVVFAFMLPAGVAASSGAAAEGRPNVLLIMADDVGCETLGCYGGTSYATPQIDALAAAGMRFTHCFSMPVCHPTRTTLLSGRYPFRLGNPGWGTYPKAEEKSTLAWAMKRAGYATAVAGKWQLTLLKKDPQHPHRLGFDQYSLFGWHEGPRYHDPLIWQNGEIREDTEGDFGPDLYVDYLIDFIRRSGDKPWFAFYSMALCHDVTDDLKAPVPHAPGKDRYLNYAEMMAAMDRCVGRLVDAVDEMGLADKTVVLFTTDNGTAQRSKLRAIGKQNKFEYETVVSQRGRQQIRGGKGKLTDGGTNVPLIVRWPGAVKPGTVVDHLVDCSDFYPTCVELAGGRAPAELSLDGHSFAGLVTGGDYSPRDFAFAQGGGKHWVRTQQFKLYSDGRFFNVANDPQETGPLDLQDLSPAAAAARRRLRAALDALNAG
ncbi:MAG: sulfatase-like hydrolase/transferase [Planctomycetes bacterium]|nr:sulfatase-like hydrolase/transferase [Planctomycetota bacterium]